MRVHTTMLREGEKINIPLEFFMMCLSLLTRDLSVIYQLLSQFVCDGCVYSQRVATLNSRPEFCCPFCRYPAGDVNDCGLLYDGGSLSRGNNTFGEECGERVGARETSS